jgi:hypothetical protein
MSLTRWFVASALVGVTASLLVILLLHGHVKVSPTVAVSIYPTILLVVSGPLGMSGKTLWIFTILLNGLFYGLTGWLGAFGYRVWQHFRPAKT